MYFVTSWEKTKRLRQPEGSNLEKRVPPKIEAFSHTILMFDARKRNTHASSSYTFIMQSSIVLLLLVVVSSPGAVSARLLGPKIFDHKAAAAAAASSDQRNGQFKITHCEHKVENEYILSVDRSAIDDMPTLVNDFELLFPYAKVLFQYKRAFHGFAVSGVSEEEVQHFANGCNNLILEILENGQAHKTQEEWGLDRIDSRQGTDGKFSSKYNGKGVTVYVVDTG